MGELKASRSFLRADTSTARSSFCACAGIFGFKLSLRDLVEMMAERGLLIAHTTIMRWVRHYAPEFEKRWRQVSRSWRVDAGTMVLRTRCERDCI